jgi:hypothetical protein
MPTPRRSFPHVYRGVCGRLFSPLLLLLFCLALIAAALPLCRAAQGSNSHSGAPYSFSLTTFDPSGQLGQVQRAGQAAARGVPLVALIDDRHTLWLAAPQRLPSARGMMLDDGTARWTRLTPTILVAHTGVGGDGRLLLATAHQIALSHVYQYGRDISLATLLSELALSLQDATRQPGGRPLGVTLVVAHVPNRTGGGRPTLVRLDPSGAMVTAKRDDGPYRLLVNHEADSLEGWNELGNDLGQERSADAAHTVLANWWRAKILAPIATADADATARPGSTSLLTCRLTADGEYSVQRQEQPGE